MAVHRVGAPPRVIPYVLVTGDFVRTGGMDVANYSLASYLARNGADVHLVAHRADPELLAMPNIRFHHVAKLGGSYLLGAPLLRRAGARWTRALAHQGARVVANGGNCETADTNWVHYVHAAYTPTMAGSLARRAIAGWSRRGFVADEHRALARARLVVTNSNRTRADVVERLGVTPDRAQTVYYGTDPNHHRPPSVAERATARSALGWDDDAPTLVFVGALGDRRKGFDRLFAAWERLCADPNWPARLVVVGAGGELAAWRARAERLGRPDRIRFLGFTRDVRSVLWACDALVAPARYEAYGLAVHEAVCCGLPSIVTEISGVAERLPELQPLQFPAGDDPEPLVSAIDRWTSAPGEWRARALAASTKLRAWTWDDMAARIVSLMTHAGAP
jgi:glycosyltransferase involved in cell wall biosynthesis